MKFRIQVSDRKYFRETFIAENRELAEKEAQNFIENVLPFRVKGYMITRAKEISELWVIKK